MTTWGPVRASAVSRIQMSLPISDEQFADTRETAAAVHEWMNATPEQRAQWAAEAKQRRAEQRAAAAPVALTLDALIGKLGWSREYAEHVVQPYCECWDGMDGWEYCQYARDEGLV